MRRTPLVLVVAALGASLLAAPSGEASVARTSAPPPAPAAERGPPGTWTKVSTGGGSITFSASLYRTPSDRVLHVVYPRVVGSDAQLGHTSVRADGQTILQTTVLPTNWDIVEASPVVMAGPAGGLRVAFGGSQTSAPGFWSNGKMYTLTAPASGAGWTLPMETVGNSGQAFASQGTAGTTLSDGTPVAGFASNSNIVWHVGTAADPDQSFTVPACCAYDLAMVRSGNEVYVAWYADSGGSDANQGTFVRRILPTLGPTMKAPGSSVGSESAPTEKVALAARVGGGVYVAYCAGWPTCNAIKVWRAGSGSAMTVPGSRYASRISLAAAPSGRLWLAWGNNIPDVTAVRTNRAATRFGANRNLQVPRGHNAIYSVAVEGSTGRGDVVINVGDGFWHTQVLAGLTLQAAPARWNNAVRKRVLFTVSDAGERVGGARVTVGMRHCTTNGTGQCRITFPRGTRVGRPLARATKASYGPGTRQLRIT